MKGIRHASNLEGQNGLQPAATVAAGALGMPVLLKIHYSFPSSAEVAMSQVLLLSLQHETFRTF